MGVVAMESIIDRLQNIENSENSECDEEQKEMSPVNEECTLSERERCRYRNERITIESEDKTENETTDLVVGLGSEDETSTLDAGWRLPVRHEILKFLSFLATMWMAVAARPSKKSVKKKMS